MRGRRRERSFDAAYTLGILMALLILAAMLVFIILIYLKDQDFNEENIVKAIENITISDTVNITIPPVNISLNLSALIPPVCVLWQYDVPYACGDIPLTVQFGEFSEGVYSAVFILHNPNLVSTQYDGFITSVIPVNNQTQTITNATILSKYSEEVYNCSLLPIIFPDAGEGGGEGVLRRRDLSEELPYYDTPLTHTKREEPSLPQGVKNHRQEEVLEKGINTHIIDNGHHIKRINKLAEHYERHNIYARAPAEFYAGIWSVSTPTRMSGFLYQVRF